MSALVQQISHGVRSLRSRPRFTIFAVVALGLGMGANCALFTVLNALLLRPFPYPHAEQLVEVSTPLGTMPLRELAKATSFSDVGAFTARGFSVRTEEGVRNLYGNLVTPNLFQVLGVRPLLGRILTPDDEDRPVILLSYEYWRQISGRPDIIGQTITIVEDQQRTVVGVLPADFTLQVRDANIFVPARLTDGRIIARLKPGTTSTQAEPEVVSIVQATGAAVPHSASPPRVTPIARAFRPNDANTLWLFQAAVGLVLLITCANVANLLLVHGSARRREFAIRAAIGAGRARLLSQLMIENTVLALAGGALGLLLASWSLDFLRTVLPVPVTRVLRGAEGLSIDGSVVGFGLGLCLVTVLLFGLAPAISTLRFDLLSSLRDTARGATHGRQRFGNALVAAEVGLALMLLAGAGLTLKSLLRLYNQNLGFTADHVLRSVIELPRSRYPLPQQKVAAFAQLLDRLRAIPGVESAAIVQPQLFPFGGPAVGGSVFAIQGRPGMEPRGEFYGASSDYFRTMRIPVIRGRSFTEADNAVSQPVVLISDIVAQRYWSGEDPIGRQMRQDPASPTGPLLTIIGVTGNVRNPVGADFTPVIYRHLPQTEASSGTIMIRTTLPDPMSLSAAVRREILVTDPNAAFRAADLGLAVTSYVSYQRFTTSLLGTFSGVGLLLAAIGIFGVTRYWVSIRTPEIGVRMALGASRSQILRHVLRRSASSAALGVALGLAGAFALQKVISSQLYGVSALDPAVLIGVSVLMALVSIVASLVPALRASRVDPATALRHE